MNSIQNIHELETFCATYPKEQHKLELTKEVLIFGAGKFGRNLCSILVKSGYKIAGFVETNPKQQEINGIPVIKRSELTSVHREMQLIIGIYNREMPLDELQLIANNDGFKNIYMPWHIYTEFGAELGWRYWLSSPQLIINGLQNIRSVYHRLSDEKSKQCLLNIVTFRLGYNLDYAGFKHEDNQYFNDLTLLNTESNSLNYVDGGAYNGDTYLELLTLRNINSAVLFEPDQDNYKQLIRNFGTSNSLAYCLPIALTDNYSILTFNSDDGEGAAISDQGKSHIATAALDDLIHGNNVNFIKLDVEGAEALAIKGASKLINQCRPILAISLYHKPADIWEIPLLIDALCKNYRFYIRQHHYNSFESVFYAIPD